MRKFIDQERVRRQKLAFLRDAGFDPYPARVGTREPIAQLRERFEADERQKRQVRLVGRIRAIRLHGSSMFVDVDDGDRVQCFLTRDDLKEHYDLIVKTLDVGDFVEVRGIPFTTKRGEKTIKANSAAIIAKALRPLPEKRRGLADVELRYRHRELDLLANEATSEAIRLRGRLLAELRMIFLNERFLEVETPVLQPIPGGANARPFVTHHHALDADLYLRIAPELYLKRLVIGGLERVFEVARCFRNEGIDHEHNPEFTQIEAYAAYTDYEWMMEFTERLIIKATTAVVGTPSLTLRKRSMQLTAPFPRMTFRSAIQRYTGIDIEECSTARELAQAAKKKGADVSDDHHRAYILDELFKTFVRKEITDPVFIVDHPIELSPLAKKKPNDPRYVERFQLLVGGTEIANAFSELNDPIEQRARFETQEDLRRTGDEEAQRIDEEFLEALEYGLPPTSGLGLGIDRLVMLLANEHSIKEVIAFPTLKPKS